MRIHRSAGLAATLTIAAFVVAACGGTASSPGAAGATGTAAPDAATPTAAGSVAPASVAPDESTPAFAIPSFDLSQLGGGAIPGLDSYRVALSSEGKKQYESVVVTKPEVAKHITSFKDDGTPDSQFILIGKKAWQSDDGTTWTALPDAMAQGMLLAFDPAILFGAYSQLDWTKGASDKGAEDKNGIPTHHFSIDAGSVLGATLPAGTAVDLWVADAGYLVALEVAANGSSALQVEVSGVNDPANAVEPPAS